MHISNFDYKFEWKPLTIQIDSQEFYENKPTSFNIITLDEEGVVIEKWMIGNIKEYKKSGSITTIKFGFAFNNC